MKVSTLSGSTAVRPERVRRLVGHNLLQSGEDSKMRVKREPNHLEKAKHVRVRTEQTHPAAVSDPLKKLQQAAYPATIDVRAIRELKEQSGAIGSQRLFCTLREFRNGRAVEVTGKAEHGDFTECIGNDFQR